jgi:hypothetical protein
MTGIFTLDATMALVLSMLVLSTAVYLIAAPKAQSSEYLFQSAGDLLAVAEEDHLLSRMVQGDSGAAQKLKASLPPQACIELYLRNATGGLVYSDSTNCAKSDDFVIGRRTFVSDSAFYSAELRLWLK